MRWQGRRASANVEDRRGRSPMVTRGLPMGCGGVILIGILFVVFGGDPQQLLEVLEQTQGPSAQVGGGTPYAGGPAGAGAEGGAPADELGEFAAVVLADTEDTWNELFAAHGTDYREPTLVLFSDAVQSACGLSSAAVGPFYCPADRQVYLDLSFFDQLARRFGAPGDFAQAYVIAHEVGHHVQNLLGISGQVQDARRWASEREANRMSVALELQADCLAGVWGYHARDLLEPGDVEEGLRAAAAIGDDALQRQATGTVRPESWTHGSSEQRVEWLNRGLRSGDPDACETTG
jgi:predicted metalloprotease